MSVEPRWASLERAGEYLDVHPRTVRRMINDGRIPGYRLGPRVIRVDLNDIDQWLNRVEVGETE